MWCKFCASVTCVLRMLLLLFSPSLLLLLLALVDVVVKIRAEAVVVAEESNVSPLLLDCCNNAALEFGESSSDELPNGWQATSGN